MAIPPRRWLGHTLLATGVLLLFDTYTYQTDKSPLRVPLDACRELALGYVLALVVIPILLWPWISGIVEEITPMHR